MTFLGRGRRPVKDRAPENTTEAGEAVEETAETAPLSAAERRAAEAKEKARKAAELAELAEQAAKEAAEAAAALDEADDRDEDGPEAAETTEDSKDSKGSNDADEPGEDAPEADAKAEDDSEADDSEEESGEPEKAESAETVELSKKADPEDAKDSADSEDSEDEPEASSKSEKAEKSEKSEKGEDSGGGKKPLRRRVRVAAPAGGSRALVSLALVAVLVAAGVGWLWTQKSNLDATQDATKQATYAATQAAQSISSYDYRTVDADMRRATGYATGQFRKEFEQQAERVRTLAPQEQAMVTGTAVKTAVEEMSPTKGTVLVFLNQQTVKSTQTDKSGQPQRLPSQFTLRMSMTKVGDRWLASKVEVL
ncbi:hypothetical protein [Spirillospora sp. NPDC029432]|uniref:hypothetical protein n=1 Tax=Spirillospora sp. NPDC029432 TaxID=3154599 RepID=UPI003452503D